MTEALALHRAAPQRSRRPRRTGRPTSTQAARLDRDVRECALRQFLEQGYDGTSMDDIARAAGTTKMTLYSRFKTKEDLFSSVLWWALHRADWPLAEPKQPNLDDLRGALWVIAQAALERALHPSMVKLSRIAATHALRFPDIAQRALMFGVSSRFQLVLELLERHAARGAIVVENAPILAEHFLAMVSGAPARLALFGIVRDPQDARQRLRIAVDLFIRSLQRPSPLSRAP